MAKKKTENNSIAQPPAVVLREGKWVTADGLCFNTATKAWKHTKEISHVASLGSEADPESEPESEPETSPEPEDPDTEPDSDPE